MSANVGIRTLISQRNSDLSIMMGNTELLELCYRYQYQYRGFMPISFSKRWTCMFYIFSTGR